MNILSITHVLLHIVLKVFVDCLMAHRRFLRELLSFAKISTLGQITKLQHFRRIFIFKPTTRSELTSDFGGCIKFPGGNLPGTRTVNEILAFLDRRNNLI